MKDYFSPSHFRKNSRTWVFFVSISIAITVIGYLYYRTRLGQNPSVVKPLSSNKNAHVINNSINSIETADKSDAKSTSNVVSSHKKDAPAYSQPVPTVHKNLIEPQPDWNKEKALEKGSALALKEIERQRKKIRDEKIINDRAGEKAVEDLRKVREERIKTERQTRNRTRDKKPKGGAYLTNPDNTIITMQRKDSPYADNPSSQKSQ